MKIEKLLKDLEKELSETPKLFIFENLDDEPGSIKWFLEKQDTLIGLMKNYIELLNFKLNESETTKTKAMDRVRYYRGFKDGICNLPASEGSLEYMNGLEEGKKSRWKI